MSGKLFYLIGASGAGKDSLLRAVRDRQPTSPAVMVAHRYITRAPHVESENFISLSTAEFTHRRDQGLFAMYWHSYAVQYGIGIEIDHWLAAGQTVLVNGARRYLLDAWLRYPALQPILVSVNETTLRSRLFSRGRETEEQIDERLAQARKLQATMQQLPAAQQSKIHHIDNNGHLSVAIDQLMQIVAPPSPQHKQPL